MRFLDIFALYCLLHPSPPFDEKELENIKSNNQSVVLEGLNPLTTFRINGKQSSLVSWVETIWPELGAIAELLDHAHNSNDLYRSALKSQHEKIKNRALTPSSKILSTLSDNKINFYDFAMEMASLRAKEFRSRTLSPADQAYYEQMAKSSHDQQSLLEQQNDLPFETYLRNYLNA